MMLSIEEARSMSGLEFSFSGYRELLVAASFILLLVFRWCRCRRSSKIPVNWPIVGMLPALIANIHRMHEWQVEILAESGCTFKFKGPWLMSMDFFFTADPANVNHIFNARFSSFDKGDELSMIMEVFGDGIFTADDQSWRTQRKMAETFTAQNGFQSMVTELSREKVVSGLIPLLHRLAKEDKAFDLQDLFMRLTFDITCGFVLGVDPGCLSPDLPTVPFARAMDDAMTAVAYRYCMPPCCWRMLRLLRIGYEKKLYKARYVMDSFLGQIITDRKRELWASSGSDSSSGGDLLTCYINHVSKDETFLRDTTVNFILAGRDTTGVSLTWFFWLLAVNPHIESKILEEINSKGGNQLTYLHAALLESLRLYPPVPFEMKVPKEDEVLPAGGEVHAGTRILMPLHAMGRMEGVWGEDCREWRPERWITKEGKLRHEASWKFMAFNSGPRICLGKKIALAHMKAVAVAVLPLFRFETVPGHVVEPKLSAILHMKNGLKIKAMNRV